MSHLWVQNGLIESTNKISLGWHVSCNFHIKLVCVCVIKKILINSMHFYQVIPELYGDYASHFYSSWTVRTYQYILFMVTLFVEMKDRMRSPDNLVLVMDLFLLF